jgi:hypothetical protein
VAVDAAGVPVEVDTLQLTVNCMYELPLTATANANNAKNYFQIQLENCFLIMKKQKRNVKKSSQIG